MDSNKHGKVLTSDGSQKRKNERAGVWGVASACLRGPAGRIRNLGKTRRKGRQQQQRDSSAQVAEKVNNIAAATIISTTTLNS